MTISATNHYDPFIPNGIVRDFGFTFRCDDPSWVYAELDSIAVVGFTVNLNEDQITNPGGIVTFGVAPVGTLLVIARATPLSQLTAYDPYGRFPANSHEAALDKITMAVQDFAELATRVMKSPIGTPPEEIVSTFPSYVGGAFWAWHPTEPGVVVNVTGLADAPVSVAMAPVVVAATIPNALTALGFSGFIQTLINDADAATARATLGVNAQWVADNTKWIDVKVLGSSLALTAFAAGSAVAALNATDVAFIDDTNDTLKTYRFDGSAWSLVGGTLAIGSTGNVAMAALNGTDVAFIDSGFNSLQLYRLTGGVWALVGSVLSVGAIGAPALAALNGTDVVLVDSVTNTLRAYRFNGSTWAALGSSIALGTIGLPSLTALNGTDVAIVDVITDTLRAYRFNGSTWAALGSGLTIAMGGPAIAAVNEADVVIIDNALDKMQMYRFNGSTWAAQGLPLSLAAFGSASMTALNGTDVVVASQPGQTLQAYRFNFYTGPGPRRTP